MEPLISLLHPTIRPDKWRRAMESWAKACDHPEDVEYVLVPEQTAFANKPSLDASGFGHVKVEYNRDVASLVGATNYAAKISTGKILFMVADDFYAAPHWDTDLLKLLRASGTLDREAVVWANTHMPSLDDHTIVFPILTRAYYERSGSYIFWPEYTAFYSDVEFNDVAILNGVEIIDARKILLFKHYRGGIDGSYHDDEAYKKGSATGAASGDLYYRRKAAGFPGRG